MDNIPDPNLPAGSSPGALPEAETFEPIDSAVLESMCLSSMRQAARNRCRVLGLSSSWASLASSGTLRNALLGERAFRDAAAAAGAVATLTSAPPAGVPAPPAGAPAGDVLGAALMQAMSGMLAPAIHAEVGKAMAASGRKITELAQTVTEAGAEFQALASKRMAELEALAAAAGATVTVRRIDVPDVKVTGAHPRLATLIRMLSAGVNVWIYGPAGSGKSFGARQAAEALGREVEYVACSEQTLAQELTGWRNATGAMVETPVTRAWRDGGALILDEVDRLDPGAASTLHEALAGGTLASPEGPIARHANTIVVGTANTGGHGGDRVYTSARQQDAALRSRFAMLLWGYDEGHETRLATAHAGSAGLAAAWCSVVRSTRAKLAARAARYVVSPRAVIDGCRLLRAGLTVEEAIDATVRQGMNDGDWTMFRPDEGLALKVAHEAQKALAKAEA